MVIADASGLPLALHTDSAGPHEVTLVQATLGKLSQWDSPEGIIGDRAYDSDPLDNALAAQGIEMIAPHRRNRKRKATQDGRPLRRYRRRWKIERLFAWLNTFKRTMARWDRFHQRFTAFVHLGIFHDFTQKSHQRYEMTSNKKEMEMRIIGCEHSGWLRFVDHHETYGPRCHQRFLEVDIMRGYNT